MGNDARLLSPCSLLGEGKFTSGSREQFGRMEVARAPMKRIAEIRPQSMPQSAALEEGRRV